jgi:hypothetical protein
MHHDIFGMQFKEARKVAGIEQLARLPHELCVGMFHCDPPHS